MNIYQSVSELIEDLKEWSRISTLASYRILNRSGIDSLPDDIDWTKFANLTDRISVWCDSGQCTVDPDSLIHYSGLLRRHYRLAQCERVPLKRLYSLGAEVEFEVSDFDQELLDANDDAHRTRRRIKNVAMLKLGVSDHLQSGQVELDSEKSVKDRVDSALYQEIREATEQHRFEEYLENFTVRSFAERHGCSVGILYKCPSYNYIKNERLVRKEQRRMRNKNSDDDELE